MSSSKKNVRHATIAIASLMGSDRESSRQTLQGSKGSNHMQANVARDHKPIDT